MRRELPEWIRDWRSWFNPIPLAALLIVLLTGWYMVFGDQGLLMLKQLQNTQRHLEQSEQLGHQRLEQLTEEAKLLKDPRYLEPLIRAELGYVKPGEVVYQFSESQEEQANNGKKK